MFSCSLFMFHNHRLDGAEDDPGVEAGEDDFFGKS